MGFDPFPKTGSFSSSVLTSAALMICDGYGDPNWDYKYIKESFKVCR